MATHAVVLGRREGIGNLLAVVAMAVALTASYDADVLYGIVVAQVVWGKVGNGVVLHEEEAYVGRRYEVIKSIAKSWYRVVE